MGRGRPGSQAKPSSLPSLRAQSIGRAEAGPDCPLPGRSQSFWVFSEGAPHAAQWEFFPRQSLTLSCELCGLGPCEREKPQPRGPLYSRDLGRERIEQQRGRGVGTALSCSSDLLGQVQENRRKQMNNLTNFFLKVSFNDSSLPYSRSKLSE